jgi:DNA-directed RNA polymerase specialized sigma24 family protein
MDEARSDAELLARAGTDPELFGVVFDRHFVTIHRYLERRIGADGADELTAEVFRIAFEQRRRFRPLHESALPWLYGVATNLLLKRRRSERRHLRALTRLEARTDRHGKVTGAVGCTWLERWVAARRAGDAAGVRQAVAALATSHHWRVLQEMQADGAWPQVFWDHADAAADGAPVMGGKPLSVEESYRDALGCTTG